MIAPEARAAREPMAPPAQESPSKGRPGSVGQPLLKRMVIYIPGSLVPAILTLVTSIVFTRIFSPVAFGKYSLFLVYAAPIELLFTAWLNQSIGKFLPPEQTPEGRQRVKDAVFLSIALIFFGETVLGVCAFAVASSLLAPGWRSFLLPTFLFIIFSSFFDILTIVFPSESRAKEYVSYQLSASVATFGLRLGSITIIDPAFCGVDPRVSATWQIIGSQSRSRSSINCRRTSRIGRDFQLADRRLKSRMLFQAI